MNAQVKALLQEEAQSLGEAKQQIDLLATAVLQLEQKVVKDCEPFVERPTETNESDYPIDKKRV